MNRVIISEEKRQIFESKKPKYPLLHHSKFPARPARRVCSTFPARPVRRGYSLSFPA